jgi:hypothetical protein
MREPAMLKEFERHLMLVASPEIPVPTFRTGLTLLVLTDATSATRIAETSPRAVVAIALDGAVLEGGGTKDVETIAAGLVEWADAVPCVRLFVAPNPLPLHAHHLQPLFR